MHAPSLGLAVVVVRAVSLVTLHIKHDTTPGL